MKRIVALGMMLVLTTAALAESWVLPSALSAVPKKAYMSGLDEAPFVAFGWATDIDNRMIGDCTELTAENMFWPVTADGSRNFAAAGFEVRPINAEVTVTIYQLVNGRISADTTKTITIDPSPTSALRYLSVRMNVFALRILSKDATDDTCYYAFYSH